jgi:hypothetical protein
VNESGNKDAISAETVPMLLAMRSRHGADTPIGHRCSNVIEMLRQPVPYRAGIRRQLDDIERLLQR